VSIVYNTVQYDECCTDVVICHSSPQQTTQATVGNLWDHPHRSHMCGRHVWSPPWPQRIFQHDGHATRFCEANEDSIVLITS